MDKMIANVFFSSRCCCVTFLNLDIVSVRGTAEMLQLCFRCEPTDVGGSMRPHGEHNCASVFNHISPRNMTSIVLAVYEH